jgi:hypothetical protein
MAREIGQFSWHQPAVVFDGTLFHMVFTANDDSNRILYATSLDGNREFNFLLGPDTNQTSGAAPALSIYQPPPPWRPVKLLVLVFVANDPSNRILYSILDLNEDPNTRGWRYGGQVGNESAQAVSTAVDPAGFATSVFFIANDSSDRILQTGFTPFPQ